MWLKSHNNVASNGFALLATLFFAFGLSGCIKNSPKDLKAFEDEIGRATLSAYDLHSLVTDMGNYRYEFDTPELHQYDNVEEPYVDFPGGLTFKAFNDGGETVKSRISCHRARFFKSKNLWELNNDVVAVTEKGDVLNTEQMFWNTEDHKVYSERFVKITSKGQLITGRGFESDDRMTYYEIKHPGGEIEVDGATRDPEFGAR